MKIEKIELYQLDLPYAGGVYRLSGGRTYESFDASIVRITCDDGTEGWGESTPFGSTYIAAHSLGVRAGIAELAPVLLGRDPRQTDRITDVMDSTLAGHNHAKDPLDVALLRCVLNCEDMVALKTAEFAAVFNGDGVLPVSSPGLGITVDEEVLGDPDITWGD